MSDKPTNKQIAEILGISEEEAGTYALEPEFNGGVWRVPLAFEILSPKRVKADGERIPENLILEIPATS